MFSKDTGKERFHESCGKVTPERSDEKWDVAGDLFGVSDNLFADEHSASAVFLSDSINNFGRRFQLVLLEHVRGDYDVVDRVYEICVREGRRDYDDGRRREHD